MKRGLQFTGLIRCDQPKCDYAMRFIRTYTGHVVDQLCVRIDALDHHRFTAHPEVVAAENEDEEAPSARA